MLANLVHAFHVCFIHKLVFVKRVYEVASEKLGKFGCILFISSMINPAVTTYRQVSNIRRTLVGNKIVEHSDVVWASPVGAAPTTSSFSTQHLATLDRANTTARRKEEI